MRAAFYEKDITPPLGCYLEGSYVRHFADDVLDPLYVKAAVIENGETVVMLIAIDACEYMDDLHDAVVNRITEYTGIRGSQILVSVNHTHKGIPIMDSPELDAYADPAYKDVVFRLIADCGILAYRRLYEAELSFGKSTAEGIAFNRTFRMKDGTFKTNIMYTEPENIECNLAGVDEEVPVLFVKDKNGKPKGALVSFACHQDVNPGTAYSGGFASVLSRELKERFGQDFVTVFFAGACGDINHLDPAKRPDKNTYVTMGKVLAEAVLRAEADAKPVGSEELWSRKELFRVPKRACTTESVLEDIKGFAEEGNLSAIRNIALYEVTNKTQEMDVYLQCIKVGNVMFYCYSGEIFVNFGLDLKKRSSYENIIITTLSNTSCGYVATREAFAPNSMLYEKKLCIGACLAPEAGYLMTDRLLEMGEGGSIA